MAARPLVLTLVLLAAGRAAAAPPPRLAHAFVALCDNDHQGIVPVSKTLGNGDDPRRNLYWGAGYGIRGLFDRAAGWKRLAVIPNPTPAILERVVYRHQPTGLLLVADGYRGREIAAAMRDFLTAAAGRSGETLRVDAPGGALELALGKADLLAYVGHDGLMDASWNPEVAALLRSLPERAPDAPSRPVVVIACASRNFFGPALRKAGAEPLLWTTNLLPAEAYTLEGALTAWAEGAAPEQVRGRAAAAFARAQRCSEKAARRLLVTGW